MKLSKEISKLLIGHVLQVPKYIGKEGEILHTFDKELNRTYWTYVSEDYVGIFGIIIYDNYDGDGLFVRIGLGKQIAIRLNQDLKLIKV